MIEKRNDKNKNNCQLSSGQDSPYIPKMHVDRNMAVNSIFFILLDFKIDFEMNIFSE